MDMTRNMGVRHLFLTGEKGIGKSTVLRSLLSEREGELGGFRTVRVLCPGCGTVHILPAVGESRCTEENRLFTKRSGIADIDPARFARLACPFFAPEEGKSLLLMDELGPWDGEVEAFRRAVLSCLEGERRVYGVLQWGESSFLDEIRAHPRVEVVTVTAENRDTLPGLLSAQGW